jgi:hypothetical protein
VRFFLQREQEHKQSVILAYGGFARNVNLNINFPAPLIYNWTAIDKTIPQTVEI